MIAMTVTALVIYAVVFVFYKGWKVDNGAEGSCKKTDPFNRYQWYSLLGLAVLAVGVLFFGWNAGLTGFLVGSCLIILGGNDEKEAVKAIPWNVILMVLGVGVLMNVVTLSGGIDILVNGLEKIMSGRTAPSIMAFASGIMSFFSSGLGVVFPTLIPTASGLAKDLGCNAYQIVAVIVIGGSVSGFTPLSTTGALIMAGISQQPDGETRFPQNKMFIELFVVSFVALAVLAVLSYAGIIGIFVH
jgi:di/tricarboxylate transporter